MADIPARFVELIATVTGAIVGQPVNETLGPMLNSRFPPDGPLLSELQLLCRQGCIEGWLCAREQGGIKFGRPVRPGTATHGFSVDVVEMNDIVGPHHRHPHGEIDLVMPFDDGALFDGAGKGWKAYAPNSAHRPTVSGGKALVLYLLPEGAIEFTGE